ncbi:MAG: methylated-DNA--[protein]-cysteine S-methyltransferase [Chitinispirillales bacterium]|jgi:methylated-DNA-[protein]-cysteine S-methyltransferase|nr:methylated-DNA--[protein]-cysteine S-methyltransferase [Chitinispirillales bacterium]
MEKKIYYLTAVSSPIGEITLGCDDNGNLAGLWIEGQKYHGNTIHKKMTVKNDLPIFNTAKKWLDRYFAGKNPAISDLPLSPDGSKFRQQVWNILCEIPYGEIITYKKIAKKLAVITGKKSMSSQAAGGAVGHNPISIIIPCHRVVGSNGSLTGYAGGINKKIKLLELEGVDMSGLFAPENGTAL